MIDTRRRVEEIALPMGNSLVAGRLTVPPRTRGVVIFAHGSGSSRHSPRNKLVAARLNEAGFATMLFDLLTPAEEQARGNVFDIDLLAHRLIEVTRWLARRKEFTALPFGYFGASTGAAAALRAAADRRVAVSAVVSRGGRPDLANGWLTHVVAPTLLIVGSHDQVVLDLNKQAGRLIPAQCRIAVIPGATHTFDEPGALEQVAELAADWFTAHFALTPNHASSGQQK